MVSVSWAGCIHLATSEDICNSAWNIPVGSKCLLNLNLNKRTRSLSKRESDLHFFESTIRYLVAIRFQASGFYDVHCDEMSYQSMGQEHPLNTFCELGTVVSP